MASTPVFTEQNKNQEGEWTRVSQGKFGILSEKGKHLNWRLKVAQALDKKSSITKPS